MQAQCTLAGRSEPLLKPRSGVAAAENAPGRNGKRAPPKEAPVAMMMLLLTALGGIWCGHPRHRHRPLVSITSGPIDNVRKRLAPLMPAKVLQQDRRSRFGLGHARHVGSHEHPRMGPEGVFRRQGLGLGHIEDCAGQLARIQCFKEIRIHQVRAAADVDQCCSGG
ncbi:hypothetical protein D9M69_621830 [compost metagenome]